jgi:antitoxin YefM
MDNIQQFIPVTRAKAMLLDLIREIKESEEAVAITKNGVPEAVIMSMGKFQGLLETLEVFSDEKTVASIRKSILQADRGEWIEWSRTPGRTDRIQISQGQEIPGRVPNQRGTRVS